MTNLTIRTTPDGNLVVEVEVRDNPADGTVDLETMYTLVQLY